MSDQNKLESWATGCIAKRTPDALRALSYLLEAGLRRGDCSAADIPEAVTFAQVNVVGAVFKLLPRCGFYKDRSRWVTLTVRKKHGRDVPVWVLEHRWKAEIVLRRLLHALPLQPGQIEQMGLL